MRKLVKAAAALTAGCMLLSTSAFAMKAEITELKDGVATVTITELGEGQSTILVLEGKDTAVEAASESNILYINQDEIVGGAVTYTVNLGANFEGNATVWAGGTNETATKVGLLNAPVKAKGITLKEGENDAADKTVDAGAVINLAAVLNPENAEDTITWTVNGASDAALVVAADAKSAVFTAPELTETGTYEIKAAVSETIYDVVKITVNAKVVVPDVPKLPETATITVRNSNPYGMTGYSVVKVTGIDAGSVAIKDADGNEVAAYLADYTANDGIRQYVAIVKGTEFTTDSIVWDAEGVSAELVFGDVSGGDSTSNITDANEIVRYVLHTAEPTSDLLKLASDVNADGAYNITDANEIVRYVLHTIENYNPAK